jgi:hypothetical protein
MVKDNKKDRILMITLTQKQIVILNDKWRNYTKNNPTTSKSFIEFRREYIKELRDIQIVKEKKKYAKNRNKIRKLEKLGKVISNP